MARRATSLGPKPSLFIIFCFFFCFAFFFPFFAFNTQKNLVSPRKGHFCLFLSVSLCFSLAFFGLPLFLFLFLCLSLVLVLFSSFLSFFFAFFWFLFLSLSFLFFLLCFCFMKGTTSKYSIAIFSSSIFSLFLVSCLVFSFKSLFLIFAIS